MTDEELRIAESVLNKNNINASPTAYWETERYHDIAYMVHNGSTFRKRFPKQNSK